MNSNSPSPRRIRRSIDRLVLDGLPVSERQTAQVRTAFEREVSRLLTRDGLPSAWERGGAVARQDGGLFAIPRGASPAQMGRQMARSLVSSFSNNPVRPDGAVQTPT